MKKDANNRIDIYCKLNTHFAYLNDEQLICILANEGETVGWGKNQLLKIGSSKVFVKRVPITDLEYNHMFSTKNLYGLPTYYNYGIRSAGLGVFREIQMHIKTTNWVLQGANDNFPLMYHYRILPRQRDKAEIDLKQHKQYMEYWNSNENIERYILDRSNANYEVALLLEHFTYGYSWFKKNIGQLDHIIREMIDTITFLRKNSIIHFDMHFYNILTDKRKPYLTDFGLVLDRRFDLSDVEREFYKKHTYYDYGALLFYFGEFLMEFFFNLPKTKKKKIRQKYGIKDDMRYEQFLVILMENIHEIYRDGILGLDDNFVDTVLKYHPVIMFMAKFYKEIKQNNRKDTKFQHTKLKRLIEETGTF